MVCVCVSQAPARTQAEGVCVYSACVLQVPVLQVPDLCEVLPGLCGVCVMGSLFCGVCVCVCVCMCVCVLQAPAWSF